MFPVEGKPWIQWIIFSCLWVNCFCSRTDGQQDSKWILEAIYEGQNEEESGRNLFMAEQAAMRNTIISVDTSCIDLHIFCRRPRPYWWDTHRYHHFLDLGWSTVANRKKIRLHGGLCGACLHPPAPDNSIQRGCMFTEWSCMCLLEFGYPRHPLVLASLLLRCRVLQGSWLIDLEVMRVKVLSEIVAGFQRMKFPVSTDTTDGPCAHYVLTSRSNWLCQLDGIQQ